jgi:hypothetical protein
MPNWMPSTVIFNIGRFSLAWSSDCPACNPNVRYGSLLVAASQSATQPDSTAATPTSCAFQSKIKSARPLGGCTKCLSHFDWVYRYAEPDGAHRDVLVA